MMVEAHRSFKQTPTVTPLAGYIGAEISGVDIARPLARETITAIQDALDRWKVVFFRGQRLDHASHVAFARQFGEPTYAHPHEQKPPDGFPEIYTSGREHLNQRYGGALRFEQDKQVRKSTYKGWHSDVTPAVNPPAASILRAEVVPPYGGDTTFTNMVAAYEDLSESVQRFLDGLRAEHVYGANPIGISRL